MDFCDFGTDFPRKFPSFDHPTFPFAKMKQPRQGNLLDWSEGRGGGDVQSIDRNRNGKVFMSNFSFFLFVCMRDR